MIRSHCTRLIMAALVAVCAPLAIDVRADVTAAQVAALVRQLNADSLQQRVEADRTLQDLGPDVLPHLPNPQTLEPAAAEAVRRIRVLLERQQAEQALLPGRVTLSGEMTLAQAVEAVSRQTGNSISIADLPDDARRRQIAASFDQTPFWEALLKLEQQAHVVALPDMEADRLTLVVSPDEQPNPLPVVVVGPFRIAAVAATVKPDFVQPDRRVLRVTLDLATEPRLRPLFVYSADADVEVTRAAGGDNDERPAYPALSPDARHELPLDGRRPARITYDVILPPDVPPDSLDSVNISGSLELEIAAGQERFEFPHLDEPGPITRRHGGVTVARNEVEQRGDDLHVSIRVSYDADGPKFESHRAWVFHNDVSLAIDDAPPHHPAEYETLAEGEGGVTLRYRFADAAPLPDDARLIYAAPTLITRVPVEFALMAVPVHE